MLWNFAQGVVLCILMCCELTHQDKNYYKGAVLEHIVVGNLSMPTFEQIAENLKLYQLAVKTAAKNDVDIIVFPEWGLKDHDHDTRNRSDLQEFAEDVPDPKNTNSNPCVEAGTFSTRPILTTLSCMARNNSLFLVANMIDNKKCFKCKDSCEADFMDSCNRLCDTKCMDGNYYYNTNVVFDRTGKLIARYYKRNPYYLETDMNTPEFPENVYFETDFGNFTVFICIDLFFKQSTQAIERDKIANVVFSTYFFDYIPFFWHATSWQQAFAVRNNVNLLAANIHYPPTGTLGSGIYSSTRGALIYSHVPDGKSRLLISKVPRSPISITEAFDTDAKEYVLMDNGGHSLVDGYNSVHSTASKTDIGTDWLSKNRCLSSILDDPGKELKEYRCGSVNQTNFNYVKLVEHKGVVDSCSNHVCCSLSYLADSMDKNYALVAVGHPVQFEHAYFFGSKMCFLAKCDSDDKIGCSSYSMKSTTVFRHATLTGNFTTKYVFPFAINSDFHLTKRKNWEFNGKSKITYANKDKSSLVFFGLYGRVFEDDTNI